MRHGGVARFCAAGGEEGRGDYRWKRRVEADLMARWRRLTWSGAPCRRRAGGHEMQMTVRMATWCTGDETEMSVRLVESRGSKGTKRRIRGRRNSPRTVMNRDGYRRVLSLKLDSLAAWFRGEGGGNGGAGGGL